MFSLFRRSPLKKAEKNYTDLLTEAMQAQRQGDIRLYSELSAKAEEAAEKVKQLKQQY